MEKEYTMKSQKMEFDRPVLALERLFKGDWIVFEGSDADGMYVRVARHDDIAVTKYLCLSPAMKGKEVTFIVKPLFG